MTKRLTSLISGAGLIIFFSLAGCQGLTKKTNTHHNLSKSLRNNHKKTKVSINRPTKDDFVPQNILKENKEFSKLEAPSSVQTVGPVAISEKERLYFELAGEKVDRLTEVELYKKCLEKYRQNDETALNAFSNLILNKFPRSIYNDNALYLQGMLAFSQKKYGESLNYYQKVLNEYPQSNKAVSALFAKGVVFRKMNLKNEAAKILAQVTNQYPGSPEAQRAKIELQLIVE